VGWERGWGESRRGRGGRRRRRRRRRGRACAWGKLEERRPRKFRMM
jgi:hypothetical protein